MPDYCFTRNFHQTIYRHKINMRVTKRKIGQSFASYSSIFRELGTVVPLCSNWCASFLLSTNDRITPLYAKSQEIGHIIVIILIIRYTTLNWIEFYFQSTAAFVQYYLCIYLFIWLFIADDKNTLFQPRFHNKPLSTDFSAWKYCQFHIHR